MRMTDKETAQAAEAVLDWAERNYAEAIGRRTQASAEWSGKVAARQQWENDNPDDGVGCISSNPFGVVSADEGDAFRRASANASEWKIVFDFVKHRICQLIPGEHNCESK